MGRSMGKGASALSGFAISTLMFGLMFGIAATSAGLSRLEALTMSALVFSGSVQFASLEVWNHPAPLVTILISSILISSRNILLGLVLIGQFPGRDGFWRILSMSFLTDPNAITTLKLAQSNDTHTNRIAYMLGGGFILHISWMVGTFCGLTFTDLFGHSQIQAMRFSGVLVMSTLMMVLFAKGNTKNAFPWIVSGLCAAILTIFQVHSYLIMPSCVLAGVLAFFYKLNTSRESQGKLP